MLISLVSFFVGGKHFSELSVFAHFARIVLPLAYLYYLRKEFAISLWLLKSGITITFATHGWEALQANPVFIDYLIGFFYFSIQEQTAIYLLMMVGVLDLLVAMFIWKPSCMLALYWVVFWGFLTAVLRVYDAGLDNFPEFLVRIPNFSLGLILLVATSRFSKKVRRQEGCKIP
jgi:hypothetical protein